MRGSPHRRPRRNGVVHQMAKHRPRCTFQPKGSSLLTKRFADSRFIFLSAIISCTLRSEPKFLKNGLSVLIISSRIFLDNGLPGELVDIKIRPDLRPSLTVSYLFPFLVGCYTCFLVSLSSCTSGLLLTECFASLFQCSSISVLQIVPACSSAGQVPTDSSAYCPQPRTI